MSEQTASRKSWSCETRTQVVDPMLARYLVGRLVEKEELRLDKQRTRQDSPPPPPSGESLNRRVGLGCREAEASEDFPSPILRGVSAECLYLEVKRLQQSKVRLRLRLRLIEPLPHRRQSRLRGHDHLDRTQLERVRRLLLD